MSDRLRKLDDQVLGKPVPDDRPMAERLLRPRPAVWSTKGRLLLGAVTISMFAVLKWVSDPVVSIWFIVVLWSVGLLVVFADERQRARRFHGEG